VVDSAGWIEYLAGGPKANGFAAYLDSQAVLLLPSIVVYKVLKKLYRELGKGIADVFMSHAFDLGNRLIPLTLQIALKASIVSLEDRLPMTDAIIYTTASHENAQLITSDAHFANLPGVVLI